MEYNFRDDDMGTTFVDQLRFKASEARRRAMDAKMMPCIQKINKMMEEAAARGEFGIDLYELESWDKEIPIKEIREHYARAGFKIMCQNQDGKQF